MTDQWEYIKTAPKDGRLVLLGYQDIRGDFACRTGVWLLVHESHQDKPWAWAWTCPFSRSVIDQRATHWSPSFKPPEYKKVYRI